VIVEYLHRLSDEPLRFGLELLETSFGVFVPEQLYHHGELELSTVHRQPNGIG
jgi:hypothetical protein